MDRKQKRAVAEAGRLLALAVAHHRGGRLAEAEGLYRQVLTLAPDHPDARHLLGVLAHQAGHSEAAVGLIRQALAAGHQAPEVHTNLGLVLQALGRFDEAAEAFLRVTALRPNRTSPTPCSTSAFWPASRAGRGKPRPGTGGHWRSGPTIRGC